MARTGSTDAQLPGAFRYGLSTVMVVTGALATFFGSGVVGRTLFVDVSELHPAANRATGLSWAAAWQQVRGLVLPVTAGVVLSRHLSSYLFFVLFAVISGIAALVGAIATLETRGKSVEQIAAELGGMPSQSAQPADPGRQ